MRIREIDNYSDFLDLEKEWNNLLERCNHTVFSTWEWLSTWWKHYRSDKRLVLLLATDNDEIIGIAPLMCSTQKIIGICRRKIAFIGTPHTDYSDFIIADKVEECIHLFIEYLNNLPEKWNYIELTELPENSKCIATLSNFSKTLRPFPKCPYKPLPKSRDAFWGSLNSNLKRNLQKCSRLMKKSFKIEFVDYSGVHSCVDGMHWLFKLHQKRWESRGFAGAFVDEKFRNFHLDIAKSFAEKGRLGLFLLKLSDNPVAAIYGFKDQKKFYAYLSGFDLDYSQYSIGNQLRAYVMEKCIDDGLLEFDFMRGGEAHKDRWNTLSRMNRVAVIPRSGILSNTWYWLYTKIWNH